MIFSLNKEYGWLVGWLLYSMSDLDGLFIAKSIFFFNLYFYMVSSNYPYPSVENGLGESSLKKSPTKLVTHGTVDIAFGSKVLQSKIIWRFQIQFQL